MTININFTGADWERHAANWRAWWAHELDRPLVMITTYERSAPAAEGYASNYPLEMPAGDVLDIYQARLEAARFHGDAWPKWWPNFGPGIMAGFIGAEVHSVGGPDETVWFTPTEDLPVKDIHPAYDPGNVWWQRVLTLTRGAVERWGDRVTVAYTDLGGNLDIIASLRDTQRLLYDLYDTPDEVARLVGEITGLWLRYYDALDAVIRPAGAGTSPWAEIWSPVRSYMLQCDFAYMISPDMFERFVMPDIAACCDAIDHAMYHLDGKGQIPHLDMLLSLERLRGIQWIPGDGAPPPEQWLDLLKHIIDAGKLCQLYVTPEGAKTIVDALGGKGFALAIGGVELTADDADDLVQLLTT
jgi:5-methyltetrahydrofolate--homocysteine methyltransferase